jgi:hypothetical protein
LVDAATKATPPSAVQGASNTAQQALIAGQKQKKRAVAGDTLMTPYSPNGGYAGGAQAKLKPATLIGS